MSDEAASGRRFFKPWKKPVVKANGIVQKHAFSVDVETLNQRGVTKVNFITLSKINDIIALAIVKALEKVRLEPGVQAAERLEDEARAEFRSQFERHSQSLPGEEGLAEEDRRLESAVRSLRPIVDSCAASLAEGSGGEADGDSIPISAAAYAELERRVREIAGRALAERPAAVPGGGPGSDPELRAFRAGLAAAVGEVLAAERKRAAELLEAAAARRTEILERRLKKLKLHLERLEEAFQKLARSKQVDPGIASVYREVQGLDLDDCLYEKKSELLKVIFQENLQLQKKPVHGGAAAERPSLN